MAKFICVEEESGDGLLINVDSITYIEDYQYKEEDKKDSVRVIHTARGSFLTEESMTCLAQKLNEN